MKFFVWLILILGLTACANSAQRASDIKWPADPQERMSAEKLLAKVENGNYWKEPDGLDFSFRELDEKRIADHFEYHIDELSPGQSSQARRSNLIGNFVDDMRVQACKDPDARYLLNNDYLYEFDLTISGWGPATRISEKMGKGFCVASELPMVNQKAVDERYNMVRYWPNGDRIDGRLVDKVTGAFQVVVAKFVPPDIGDPTLKIAEVKAEGLMLQVNLRREQKNNIMRSKYWSQNIKGRILAKSCTSKTSLTAFTVGAVNKYQMEILFKDRKIGEAGFTVSYSDCFLYNKQ